MFCTSCGAEVRDEAVVCVNCGCAIKRTRPLVEPEPKDDTMKMVIKVFLILGCISLGWMLLPLAWCIPITVSVFNKMEREEPVGTGLKICVLLFVSLVAGICLLCMDEN